MAVSYTQTHRILFGLKNRNPASGTTMGEPGRYMGIDLTHTHTGEPGEHISFTHTHTGESGGHMGIYLTHTRVNLEGISYTHTENTFWP